MHSLRIVYLLGLVIGSWEEKFVRMTIFCDAEVDLVEFLKVLVSIAEHIIAKTHLLASPQKSPRQTQPSWM